ncbi:competence protein ComK [Sporosarcina sp. E16_3]|uniref:competence protein ComK n=1 Tax=Sporosarcina sp. E16_3 TaxID=2789293 RepID=UPI001A938C6C|nr:competence protein ComK [Sporosarcina sp. E16_3]MBO0602532.1 competence protein ComK [Sporosarcina sp. E16_3]
MKICDSYWIDHALVVEHFYDGIHQSRIYTTEGIKLSTLTPIELLDKACMRYASTLEGRRVSASKTLNYSNKTPIVIAPYNLGAFPTSSYKKDDCVWIFNHPFQVEQLSGGRSLVKFDQGTTITVNVSKHTLLKQQQRLHTLLDIFSNAERRMLLYLSKDTQKNEFQRPI